MNSAKRILCILLITMLFAALFCGCDMLEEERANQATWENEDTIVLEGKRYLRLPYWDNINVELDPYRVIYTTQPDVPVLLASFLGDACVISVDGRFLHQSLTVDDLNTYRESWFCLEEEYQSVVDKLENGYETSGLFYEYGTYDGYEYITQRYELTTQQVNVVHQIVQSVEPDVIYSHGNYAPVDGEYILCLETADEQRIFSNSVYDVYRDYDVYYLVDYYSFDNKVCVYAVPDAQKQAFEEILSTYLKNEEGMWEDYDYEYEGEYLDELTFELY